MIREYKESFKMRIERELGKCKSSAEMDLKQEEIKKELGEIEKDAKNNFNGLVHRLVDEINTHLVNGVRKFSEHPDKFVLEFIGGRVGEESDSYYAVQYGGSGLALKFDFERVHGNVCFEMSTYGNTRSDKETVDPNPDTDRFAFQCNAGTSFGSISYDRYALSMCIGQVSKQFVLYNALRSFDSDGYNALRSFDSDGWVFFRRNGLVSMDMKFKQFYERLHVVVEISDEEEVFSKVIFKEWYYLRATENNELFDGSVTLLDVKIRNEKEFIDYINALCGSKPPSTSSKPPTHAQLLDFERRIDALRLI